MEENRDQGLNIRQKAKQITTLLADDDRLNTERQKFLQTRNKFKQGSSYSTTDWNQTPENRSDLSDARPTSAGEEEMQLQIALALSKEEHEKMDEMTKSDEVRLQLALEESRKESERLAGTRNQTVTGEKLTQSALDDLLSLGLGQLTVDNDPGSSWQSTYAQADPWAMPSETSTSTALSDPWAPVVSSQPPPLPPQNPAVANTSNLNGASFNAVEDPFSAWERDLLQPTKPNDARSDVLSSNAVVFGTNNRKTPEHFLGENSGLVNLDNLLGTTSSNPLSTSNPFLLNNQPAAPTNPFASQQRKSPTLNEMIAAQQQNRQM
ncbi:unnamed protein product [Auanema sp. JU1783]|nr:unnamed protein product [Auanema sp. JU1783]